MYKKSESIFFDENVKMSDVVSTNTLLLHVLPHFGIVNLGWNNKTVKEVCNENNVSISLFLVICNLYTFNECDFVPKWVLEQISVEELLDFLRKSHKTILARRLPEISSALLEVETVYRGIFGNLLREFGMRYEREVSDYIKYEEEVIFSYVMRLLNGEKTGSYNIRDGYNNSHLDVEAAVSDLTNIILNYFPQDTKIALCRELLFDISVFEYALKKHKLVEDMILIPLVVSLEEKI